MSVPGQEELNKQQLVYAVMTNNTERVRELLEQGVKPNLNIVGDTRSLLHYAIDQNDPALADNFADSSAIVRLLLQHGANPNSSVDSIGYTPLHGAIAYDLPADVIKLLLDKGANPNTLNNSGESPLAMAVELGNDADVVQAILAHGANTNNAILTQAIKAESSDFIKRFPERLAAATAIKTMLHNNAPLEAADLIALKEAKTILGNLKSQANTFQEKYNTQIQEKENRRRPSFLAFDRFRSNVSAKHTTAQSLEKELHTLLTGNIKTKGEFDTFISKAKALIDKHKALDEKAHKKMFSKSGKIFEALDLAEKNLPPTTKRPHS